MSTTKTPPKLFTDADIQPSSSWDGRIYCDRSELVESPTWWQKKGLQQTASGYGRKLLTPYKLSLNGKLLRVYCCCFSNSGTCYIVSKGRQIIVDAS